MRSQLCVCLSVCEGNAATHTWRAVTAASGNLRKPGCQWRVLGSLEPLSETVERRTSTIHQRHRSAAFGRRKLPDIRGFRSPLKSDWQTSAAAQEVWRASFCGSREPGEGHQCEEMSALDGDVSSMHYPGAREKVGPDSPTAAPRQQRPRDAKRVRDVSRPTGPPCRTMRTSRCASSSRKHNMAS